MNPEFKHILVKTLLMMLFFVIIVYIAFSPIGKKPINSCQSGQWCIAGAFAEKLNPVFWLLTPIVSENNGYKILNPINYDKVIAINIPYWILLSYLLSCLSVFIYKKAKK